MNLEFLNIDFVTLLTWISKIIDFVDALHRKFTEGRQYRRARFGNILGEVYYWFEIVDTEAVQRFHFNINLWSNDETLAWKDSYVSRCTAICVAAAIFASIGQSALQLNDMADAHWSASALLTASMVFGILSVCSAVALQNSVTSLSNHKEIRLWLSKGLSAWADYPDPYQNLLLESSAPIVKLISAPQLMLNLSAISYFLGFGLYLLYGWLRALTEPASQFRNNLIFYVCILGAVVSYVIFLWSGMIMDKDKVNQQFNLKRRYDTGVIDIKMEMLEKWTDTVQILTSSQNDTEKTKAKQSLEEILFAMRFGTHQARQEDGSATYHKGNETSPVEENDLP